MIELSNQDNDKVENLDSKHLQQLLSWIKNIAILFFLFEGLSQGLEYGIKHQSIEEFWMNFSLWPMLVGSISAVTMIGEEIINKLDERELKHKEFSETSES